MASVLHRANAKNPGSSSAAREHAAELVANAALGRLIERIQTALESSSVYARYLACVERNDGNCQQLWSAAMFSVLNTELDEDQATVLAGDLLKETSEAAFSRAVNARLRAEDPVERVTALALLNGNPQLKSIPVEEAAYDRMKGKPVVEVYLLLRRHQFAPVPDADTARKVLDVALDSSMDPRGRSAALAALGNQRDGKLLAGALTRLLDENNEDVLASNPSLMGALGHCGAACKPVVERMTCCSAVMVTTV